MNILVFDNYDSFTYNLVHLVQKIIKGNVEVHRNDQIPLEKVAAFDKIILSPGPGIPSEAGSLLPLIREYASSKSILGGLPGSPGHWRSFWRHPGESFNGLSWRGYAGAFRSGRKQAVRNRR